MKYKIMHSEDPLSDDEIHSFQSFDKLLEQRRQYLWKQRLYRWIVLGAATAVIIIYGWVYYIYNGTQEQPIPTSTIAAVQQQKPAIQQAEQKSPVKTTPADTIPVNELPVSGIAGNKAEKKAVTETPEKKEPAVNKPAAPALEATKTSFKEASPIGGYQPLFEYFQQSLRYPEQARQDSITGTVIIGFAINAEGKPQDLEVVKSINPALDQEALRLVAQMPAWNPALLNGKPVTTRQTVPLTFQLTSSTK